MLKYRVELVLVQTDAIAGRATSLGSFLSQFVPELEASVVFSRTVLTVLCLVDVVDRRSSGGFEVDSSSATEDELKPTAPQRTPSEGFEVTSSEETTMSTGSEGSGPESRRDADAPAPQPAEPGSPEDSAAMDQETSISKDEGREAESSAMDTTSTTPSDSQDSSAKADAEESSTGPNSTTEEHGEARTTQTKVEDKTSGGDAAMACESTTTNNTDITSTVSSSDVTTEAVVSTSQSDSDTKMSEAASRENEAEATSATATPIADDEGSNHSDEMFFDAVNATPEKPAVPNKVAPVRIAKDEPQSGERGDTEKEPEKTAEAKSEAVVQQQEAETSEPMETD